MSLFSRRFLSRSVRSRWVLWATVALLSCVVLGCCSPVSALFNPHVWVRYLDPTSSWSIAIFILAHTVAAVLGMPGTVLVVVGGVVFGLVWGTIWSVVGATLGAIAAFCVARYCLRTWVEKRFSHHSTLKTLNQLVQRNELSCVLVIRFAPISPFSVVNFLLGLTRIPLTAYSLGTFIGIIPGTLAYTWLGVTGHDAWDGENFGPFMFALTLLAGLSVLPLWWKRRQRVKSAPRRF